MQYSSQPRYAQQQPQYAQQQQPRYAQPQYAQQQPQYAQQQQPQYAQQQQPQYAQQQQPRYAQPQYAQQQPQYAQRQQQQQYAQQQQPQYVQQQQQQSVPNIVADQYKYQDIKDVKWNEQNIRQMLQQGQTIAKTASQLSQIEQQQQQQYQQLIQQHLMQEYQKSQNSGFNPLVPIQTKKSMGQEDIPSFGQVSENTKLQVDIAARRMGIDPSKIKTINFEAMTPLQRAKFFTKYTLYYKPECPWCVNLLRILARLPSLEQEFTKINLNEYEYNPKELVGIPLIVINANDKEKYLGNEAMKWVINKSTTQVIGSDWDNADTMFGDPSSVGEMLGSKTTGLTCQPDQGCALVSDTMLNIPTFVGDPRKSIDTRDKTNSLDLERQIEMAKAEYSKPIQVNTNQSLYGFRATEQSIQQLQEKARQMQQSQVPFQRQ